MAYRQRVFFGIYGAWVGMGFALFSILSLPEPTPLSIKALLLTGNICLAAVSAALLWSSTRKRRIIRFLDEFKNLCGCEFPIGVERRLAAQIRVGQTMLDIMRGIRIGENEIRRLNTTRTEMYTRDGAFEPETYSTPGKEESRFRNVERLSESTEELRQRLARVKELSKLAGLEIELALTAA